MLHHGLGSDVNGALALMMFHMSGDSWTQMAAGEKTSQERANKEIAILGRRRSRSDAQTERRSPKIARSRTFAALSLDS